MFFGWKNRGPGALYFSQKGVHIKSEVDFWPIFENFSRENAENKILKKILKNFSKN